jgi:hypothetical protein
MQLRRSLSPTDALLVGLLSLHRPAARTARPYLVIAVWCPWCKRLHEHGWPNPPFRGDVVTHRVAHCGDGPLADAGGYFIGLDPAAQEHNREVARQAAAALARHLARLEADAAALLRGSAGPPALPTSARLLAPPA